jgi:hypothetical protein
VAATVQVGAAKGGDPEGSFPMWAGWVTALSGVERGESGGIDGVRFEEDITKKGMWQDQAQTAGDGDTAAFYGPPTKTQLDACTGGGIQRVPLRVARSTHPPPPSLSAILRITI